jgi:hypothetical protein
VKPIAVFYHTLFFKGAPDHPCLHGFNICKEQMAILKASGLEDAASEIRVGVNGGEESVVYARLSLPEKATVYYQGVNEGSETPTMVRMWDWSKEHPGWNVLYFHCKGATQTDTEYLKFVTRWRNCMMNACVVNWQRCIADLDSGFESVGCHWMMNVGVPPIDNIWGGNFWWATSDFISTLPSILDRELIKTHGVAAPIARYEGERWIGAGARLPKIKDYHVNGIGSCP